MLKKLTLTLHLTLILAFPLILISLLTPYFHSALGRYEVYANFSGETLREILHKNLHNNLHKTNEEVLWEEYYTVLEYIRPPFNTELDSEFFSPEDIYHMQDVRNLFILVWIIFIVSAVCSLLQKLTWQKKASEKAPKQRKLLPSFIIVSFVIGLLLLVTWDKSFVIFHQLLFPGNDYWQLDPATSSLIKFLPGQIFQELLVIYIVLVVVVEFFTNMSLRGSNKERDVAV